MKITKGDIIDYLEEKMYEDFEDEEIEYCYGRVEESFARHLETENDETDLMMARYWLEQAWIVEDEIEK